MRDLKNNNKRLKELLFTLKVLDDYIGRFGASEAVLINQKKAKRRVKAMVKFLCVEIKDYKIIQL